MELSHKVSNEDLYEYKGDMLFIADIIRKYNELEFYTVTSQPGNMVYTSKSYCRKQRAYIRGYMNEKMARFVFNRVSNLHLIARTEQSNSIFARNMCECGSVLFIDDEPATMTFDSDKDYKLTNGVWNVL